MKAQIYVSSEDGKLFDISFCTDEVIFKLIELTEDGIDKLMADIEAQVNLLKVAYEESLHSKENIKK